MSARVQALQRMHTRESPSWCPSVGLSSPVCLLHHILLHARERDEERARCVCVYVYVCQRARVRARKEGPTECATGGMLYLANRPTL